MVKAGASVTYKLREKSRTINTTSRTVGAS